MAIIPARYGSQRFAGKLVARETGKYLIQHVYERVCGAKRIDGVLIATDDERIARACDEFGAPWRMTRADHPCGTDRIAEVASGLSAGIVVNVQGDEPEIEPGHIDRAVELLQADKGADMSTLAARFGAGEDVTNPNVVKVVAGVSGRALYFSRSVIPYYRDGIQNQKSKIKNQKEGVAVGEDILTGGLRTHPTGERVGQSPTLHEHCGGMVYYKHLGLYAYRRESLLRLSGLSPTPLEKAEKLEQLRALENGMVIAVGVVEHETQGIDTPEQYAAFVERYQRLKQ